MIFNAASRRGFGLEQRPNRSSSTSCSSMKIISDPITHTHTHTRIFIYIIYYIFIYPKLRNPGNSSGLRGYPGYSPTFWEYTVYSPNTQCIPVFGGRTLVCKAISCRYIRISISIFFYRNCYPVLCLCVRVEQNTLCAQCRLIFING